MKHILPKGTYFIGDPASLIKKNEPGDKFINTIWDLFYKDMNQFHFMNIDDIKFYVFRTEGGDGFFDGIGTDTGVIMIIDINQIKDHIVFKQDIPEKGCKVITLDNDTEAEVIDFDLDIKGHLQVKTH